MATLVQVKCRNRSCGILFPVRTADRKRGWGQYCCKSCKALDQARKQAAHPMAENSHPQTSLHTGGYVNRAAMIDAYEEGYIHSQQGRKDT